MDIKEKIKQFIFSNIFKEQGLEINNIGEEESLFDAGILDSLGVIKILSFVEDEFNVNLSSCKIKSENLASISKICDLIEAKQGIGSCCNGKED